MKGRLILIAGVLIPIVVALLNGSTYAFAFGFTGLGIVLYFLNVFLIHWFTKRRAPWLASSDKIELTAGMGIVPKWVSEMGLWAVGFVPGGLIVALLLALGIAANRG